MSFVRTGIDDVRAFALPEGIAADGRPDVVSRAALVTWRSSQAQRLHQVYANGRFAGTTIDADQRRLVIPTLGSFRSAVRVEVIAVEPEDVCTDFGNELELLTVGNERVTLTMLRSQSLPVAGTLSVYYDNGTGEIAYGEPLNAVPIPIWPCRQDKAGFGMAPFGTGDFGYEAAASVGFGKGRFGDGRFGIDADTVAWTTPPLPLGRYRFGVTVTDAQGNESTPAETDPIVVIPGARPAVGLDLAAFDQETNRLTLRILDQT